MSQSIGVKMPKIYDARLAIWRLPSDGSYRCRVITEHWNDVKHEILNNDSYLKEIADLTPVFQMELVGGLEKVVGPILRSVAAALSIPARPLPRVSGFIWCSLDGSEVRRGRLHELGLKSWAYGARRHGYPYAGAGFVGYSENA